MVQRLDEEAIKKLQEHPEEFLYIRPPDEDDFLVLNPTYYKVVICGQVRTTSWYGFHYGWHGDQVVRWENLQIQHMDWMQGRGSIHMQSGDVLHVKWGFTIS